MVLFHSTTKIGNFLLSSSTEPSTTGYSCQVFSINGVACNSNLNDSNLFIKTFFPLPTDTILSGYMSFDYQQLLFQLLGRCHRLSTIRQYQSAGRSSQNSKRLIKLIWKGNLRGIVNLLYFHAKRGRVFKTLAVFRKRSQASLLFKLGVNMETPPLRLFMRGMFKVVPPSLDDRMPKWDVNLIFRIFAF